MALVTHPRRTVLVVLGDQELPSDLAGRHYIRLCPASAEALHDLASRLRDAGCDIDQTGDHWLNPACFPNRGDLSPQPPASTLQHPETGSSLGTEMGAFNNDPIN